MDNNKKIGEWLRVKREESGKSMQYVADKLGVTKVAVHYWEIGKNKIFADTLIDYCKVIDANPQELVHLLFKN